MEDVLDELPDTVMAARRVFRHKTTKQPFRTIFRGTVVANCVALAWFVYEAPLTLP